MELPQGISLGIYLKQTKTSFLFIYKIGEQEGKNGSCLRGLVLVAGGVVGKGCGRVNIVQILCTHECKYKKDTC
jgi:hypothetical protein